MNPANHVYTCLHKWTISPTFFSGLKTFSIVYVSLRCKHRPTQKRYMFTLRSMSLFYPVGIAVAELLRVCMSLYVQILVECNLYNLWLSKTKVLDFIFEFSILRTVYIREISSCKVTCTFWNQNGNNINLKIQLLTLIINRLFLIKNCFHIEENASVQALSLSVIFQYKYSK